MPRYFFHVTHERHEPDHVGEELSDQHAAWKEATVTAGQVLRPGREWRMEVADEFQNILFVLDINAEKPR
jgi:hypothetical protein